MKKSFVLRSLVLVLFGVSGCGASADSLVKEQIQGMNDLAEALETKAPEAKVKELQKNLEETGKKLEALKLSDDEKKKLFEQHKEELMKATTRLAQAGMNKAFGDFGKGFPGMPELPAGFPNGIKK